ncbi:hypothetical protein, partial [Arthrobacter sp. SAFR-014]|uniref:hypothetical protein n=1 Tax=Arthrobacter sp. SAFR-014 TaxID=3387280 RepID=UPI003F7B712E
MPTPVPERDVTRVPPVPAMVAAPLAVLSSFAPGFFFLVALGFSGGNLSALEWVLLPVPLVLALGLIVGTALLLAGRSWRVVVVSAAVLALLVLGGTFFGGWADGALGVGLTTGVLPGAAAVLA